MKSSCAPTLHPTAAAPTRRPKSGYLPSLDGWRAIAIVGVMMAHDSIWGVGRFNNASFNGAAGNGVSLFFALSGILICSRILEEEALIGRFDIKRFYIRRIFRIQPAAFLYLSVIALLLLTHLVRQEWKYWFGSLLLYVNFLFKAAPHNHEPAAGYLTRHFWTLAVEEHFYLLLSALLFFVRKNRIALFSALLVSIYVAQKIAVAHGLYNPEVSLRRTYWVIQYLLFPAFTALLLRVRSIGDFCARFLQPGIVFAVTGVLVLAKETRILGHVVLNPFPYLAEQVEFLIHLFPFWIIATMLHPKSWSCRFLELSPLRFIGRISYSLYLWHILFFSLQHPDLGIRSSLLHALGLSPWKYLATFGVAIASYYWVEKPLMRFGHRLAPPATAGRKDMGDLPVETEAPAAVIYQN